MSFLLALLYPLAVQPLRGGWRLLLLPITVVALIVDVIANYTELALLTWDFPRKGELTFSTRLLRLRKGTHWQRYVASKVTPYLNRYDPQHVRDAD